MISELMTHLWQSTVFAAAAGMLTLAFRKNRAKVRFWLWLSASLKFFIPFALLMNLGSHVKWTPAAHQLAAQIATPAVSFAVEYVAQPFSGMVAIPSSTAHTPRVDWMLVAILGAWVCGFLAIAVIRLRSWRRIRGAVRVSTPLEIPTAVEARVAPGLLEPGVVGLLRPVLLLPEGIVDRLTESQLEAVLAHELCHVRRRDNLFASIHMIVEAVFWFHPLVWWIGARLVEERERACDEDVLSLGNQPRIYADAILNVCRLYVESPLVCVSGVTGSDIKRRIEAIMTNRGVQTLNGAKKLLLATAGLLALAGPVVIGVVIGVGHVPAIHAQSPVAVPLPAQIANLPLAQVAQAAPAAQAPASPPAASVVPDAPPILYKDRRLVVMLFDFSTMSSDDQAQARKSAVDFVHTQLKPADVVSVMAGGGGRIDVLQDFSFNQDELVAAVAKVHSVEGPGSANGVDAKLATISSAAKMLAGFTEKKALMYFSDGIGQSGMENQTTLKSVIQAATMANVAIYPMDVHAAPLAAQPAFTATPPNGADAVVVHGITSFNSTPSGGRGLGRWPAALPAGITQEEYNQRVAYAEAKLGSAKTPMGRAYIQYGAPDQIDSPTSGTSQIWRYKYLQDFNGGAAFEFSTTSPFGTHVIYPPPLATYEGRMMARTVIQVGPLVEALDREAGSPVPAGRTINGLLGGRHVSLQIDAASPAMPTPANGKFASFSIPLDYLTGSVDIVVQAKTAAGQVAANLRDSSQASVGTYRAAFTLQPGSYMMNVLVKEVGSGRLFGETINFDVP